MTLNTVIPSGSPDSSAVTRGVQTGDNYLHGDNIPGGNSQSPIGTEVHHIEEHSHVDDVEARPYEDERPSHGAETQHSPANADNLQQGDREESRPATQSDDHQSGHRRPNPDSNIRIPPLPPAPIPQIPPGHVHGLTLAPSSNQPPVRQGDFRLLIGVMNPYIKSGRRQFIRSAYSRFDVNLPIDIVFVSAHTPSWNEDNAWKVHWTHEDAKRWENETFHDLMHLDCQENLEWGKTYEFFKKVGLEYADKYTHVMKTDDDSFVNLPGASPILYRD